MQHWRTSSFGGFDKLSQRPRPAPAAANGSQHRAQRVSTRAATLRTFARLNRRRTRSSSLSRRPQPAPLPRVPRGSARPRDSGPLTKPRGARSGPHRSKSSDAVIGSRDQVRRRSRRTASTFGGFDQLSQRSQHRVPEGFDAGCGASRLCPAQPAGARSSSLSRRPQPLLGLVSASEFALGRHRTQSSVCLNSRRLRQVQPTTPSSGRQRFRRGLRRFAP